MHLREEHIHPCLMCFTKAVGRERRNGKSSKGMCRDLKFADISISRVQARSQSGLALWSQVVRHSVDSNTASDVPPPPMPSLPGTAWPSASEFSFPPVGQFWLQG